MTVYVAPPGEPLDGENWQELGTLDADGIQIEEPEIFETSIEIHANISNFKDALKRHDEASKNLASQTVESWAFAPSKEFVNAMFGYDVYALAATVAEWLTRLPEPIPAIPKRQLTRVADGRQVYGIFS